MSEQPTRLVVDLRGLDDRELEIVHKLAAQIGLLFARTAMAMPTPEQTAEILKLSPHALGLALLAAEHGAEAVKPR
jgi:hypothetical protein